MRERRSQFEAAWVEQKPRSIAANPRFEMEAAINDRVNFAIRNEFAGRSQQHEWLANISRYAPGFTVAVLEKISGLQKLLHDQHGLLGIPANGFINQLMR